VGGQGWLVGWERRGVALGTSCQRCMMGLLTCSRRRVRVLTFAAMFRGSSSVEGAC